MSVVNKQRAQEIARLQSNLMIKRNNLRLEVMRKREILEELMVQEVEKELFPELAYILNLEKVVISSPDLLSVNILVILFVLFANFLNNLSDFLLLIFIIFLL